MTGSINVAAELRRLAGSADTKDAHYRLHELANHLDAQIATIDAEASRLLGTRMRKVALTIYRSLRALRGEQLL